MTRMRRIMGWSMLLLTLGGCATSRPVSLPGPGIESDAATASGPAIEAGDTARIVLDDGTKIKGKVLAAAPDALTLEVRDERTWRMVPRAFPAARIASLEKHHANTGRTVGLIFGILLGALIVGVATSGEDMSVNFGG